MRPRHTLQLLGLAALPIVLALILVGNGSLDAPSGATPQLPGNGQLAHVSLQLSGGLARVSATQCGATRHFIGLPAQGTVRFSGTIVPHGFWGVTLKLKACYGGSFQSAGDVQAQVSPHGAYHGTFPVPIAGYYYARAELRQAGQQVARSPKVFFEVR